jgi:hypothetical protein
MFQIDNALHLSFFSFLKKIQQEIFSAFSWIFLYAFYNRLAGKSFKSAISNSGFDH